jgi:hypothetical protein
MNNSLTGKNIWFGKLTLLIKYQLMVLWRMIMAAGNTGLLCALTEQTHSSGFI